MSEILQDTSATALIAAIEENLFALIPAFRKWPRAEVHDEAEIKWSITDIPFPLFNSIFRARLVPDKIDATIQSTIAYAKARNVPLLWWTGPATQPQNLGNYLERHGFINAGQEPGMAVELQKLNEDVPILEGLTIQQAGNAEALKQWSRTCAASFGMPDFAVEAMYDFISCADVKTTLAYLGWLDDKPVAISLLVLAAGVAGIYNVATIPEARRQGIGSIITLVPLREARTRGYRVGILHASEMGVDVYRSLGFREYCKIGHYVWSPEHIKQDAG